MLLIELLILSYSNMAAHLGHSQNVAFEQSLSSDLDKIFFLSFLINQIITFMFRLH